MSEPSGARRTNGAFDVLQLMRDGHPRTRAELVQATGLSRSTVGARIESLSELGLLAPFADAVSTGGRPPSRIVFNADARVVAGADLGATHATLAISNLAGERLAATRTPLQIADRPENVLSALAETITALLEQVSRGPGELVGIGLGLPGPVEHSTGKPSKPPIMPGWDGFDVPAALQERLPVPVLVDNDVNLMALGERSVRTPMSHEMIFVKVATGIGAGIISGGELQRGAEGTAGDIGHIAVPRGVGIECTCGNTGCLEAIASGPAIARALESDGIRAATSTDVISLVQGGDLRAIQAVRQAGRDLGVVLNSCVSFLNPSLIAIGGSMAQAGEHLLAGVREVVYGRSMPLATRNLRIEQSRAGADAGVIGASILAIENALSPSRLEDINTPRHAPAPRMVRSSERA
jgi:glucokinase